MFIRLHVKYRYSGQISMKFDFFFRWIFEKYLNIKFNEDQFSGSRGVPCGRTDGRDKTDCRFLQFCESAYKNGNCRWKITMVP